MEHVIHDFQAFFAIQRGCGNSQPFKIVHQVDFNSFQAGFCLFDVRRLNTEGDVFRFHQAVVALGQLILEHFSIFLADIIETVIPVGNNNGLLEVFRSGSQVQK